MNKTSSWFGRGYLWQDLRPTILAPLQRNLDTMVLPLTASLPFDLMRLSAHATNFWWISTNEPWKGD